MVSPGTATGRSRRGAMVLRGVGFALAIVLGGLAIWLIATSDTVKSQRIGALAGMWGVLIGAYAIFGSRRHDDPVLDPSTALEIRQSASLARSEDVASQREFQARLEALLRREVQEGVARELSGLRNEVAALRNEILEKVGGQLRMERTETTRLFGSNLEALQREVRLLKVAQLGDTGSIDVATYETTTTHSATTQSAQPVRIIEPEPPQPEPARSPEPDSRPVADPLRSVTPPPAAPAAASALAATQWGEPASAGSFPPFRPLQPVKAFTTPSSDDAPSPSVEASERPEKPEPPQPVITPEPVVAEPVADAPEPTPVPAPSFESSPVPQYAPPQKDSAPLPPYVPPQQHSAPLPPYSAPPAAQPFGGSEDPFASMPRIRPFTDFELDNDDRGEGAAQSSPASNAGRHATGAAPSSSAGGRRRRADDSDNDVLARILARERPPAN